MTSRLSILLACLGIFPLSVWNFGPTLRIAHASRDHPSTTRKMPTPTHDALLSERDRCSFVFSCCCACCLIRFHHGPRLLRTSSLRSQDLLKPYWIRCSRWWSLWRNVGTCLQVSSRHGHGRPRGGHLCPLLFAVG